VIAPASVKYQWKTEIEKFTGHSVQVVDGLLPRRKQLYAAPAFFNLSSYELILRDIKYMHELRPDLIILDEAQRIRNWATATARTIKQLKSRYAFVLTGTPLENKLEELYSVVEFVDGRRLGPAFLFLHEHRTEDADGKLLGYRGWIASMRNWNLSCCGGPGKRFCPSFPRAPTRSSRSPSPRSRLSRTGSRATSWLA